MFSVVIPAFNARATLKRAVESVLAQRYRDFEVIVVDDGSTDQSSAALADIKDARLRQFRQPNLGEGKARNKGVELARHEWIAFLDADDFWFEDHLAELDAIRTAHPEAALIGTSYFVRRFDRLEARFPEAPGRIASVDYFAAIGRGEDVLCSSTATVRRGPFESIGGFGPHPAGCDTELWVRLALGWPVATSSKKTAVYVTGTGGISDRQRTRWLGKPLDKVADLSPAVAALLNGSAPGSGIESADVRLYVQRQMQWCLHGSARAGDIPTLRSLERLFQSPPQRSERAILAASRLPSPLARICHTLIFAALALDRRLRSAGRGRNPPPTDPPCVAMPDAAQRHNQSERIES